MNFQYKQYSLTLRDTETEISWFMLLSLCLSLLSVCVCVCVWFTHTDSSMWNVRRPLPMGAGRKRRRDGWERFEMGHKVELMTASLTTASKTIWTLKVAKKIIYIPDMVCITQIDVLRNESYKETWSHSENQPTINALCLSIILHV